MSDLPDTDQPFNLYELQSALIHASEELDEAKKAESAARSRATAAINRVNELQKQFDKACESIRSQLGVRDTEWGGRAQR